MAQRHDGHPERPGIPVAVTVDDLPGGGLEVPGYTHVEIVKEIIAILKAHHVQHATGFVVGSMVDYRPERAQALDAWVQAGFDVGNHTYSHDKVEELGLAGYIKDILADRALVNSLEKRTGQRHHYFRFPYLDEGRNEHERRTLRRVLAEQHYTLARVSLDFNDTDWADAYLRCVQKHDSGALQALDRSYVSSAIAQLGWSVAAAHQVFGHSIPQVLLVHVNAPTAKNLDAVLTAYERAGVRYISLDQALADPAYGASYHENGVGIIEQASQRWGRRRPPELAEPETMIDQACL